MKNKKLFVLPVLIMVLCLLSIAAIIKQCRGFTAEDLTSVGNVNVNISQTSENGENTGENTTVNIDINETSSEKSLFF